MTIETAHRRHRYAALERTKDASRAGPAFYGPRLAVHLGCLCAVVLVAVCACDFMQKGPRPIDECVEYANAVGACFGETTAEAAHRELDTPVDEGTRESQRATCSQQLARVRRACR